MRRWLLLALILGMMAGCAAQQREIALAPTATLLPIPSQLPRYTATPVPSRTPLPTFTFTPTETPIPPTPTLSPTPTMTPTIVGIIQSLQRVNVREGPGTEFRELAALAPGTGVQVIGQNPDATWYNVRLEDGREGWVAARLLFLQATSTPFPSPTPSPDLTALFSSVPLPTAILGGGTITPTPPVGIAVTATPFTLVASPTQTATPQPLVPVINLDTINMTATALAGGAATATASFTPTSLPTSTQSRTISITATDGAIITTTPVPTALSSSGGLSDEQVNAQQGVKVFAFCDDRQFGIAAPTNLRDGTFIQVWWAWFAKEEQQVRDHIDAVSYDIRVNGQPLPSNINDYRTSIRRQNNDFVAYWYVPFGPLSAGNYEITFVMSWSRTITDGYEFFGPNTRKPFEQHTCSFTVR